MWLSVPWQIVEIQNQSAVILSEEGEYLTTGTAEIEGEGVEGEEGEEETKIYMCSICQEIFSSMEAIEQHIVTHTGPTLQEEEVVDQPQDLPTTATNVTMVTEEGGVAAEAGQTLLVEGDNQAIYAITTSGGLEAIQGMDIETANTLADLSGLLTQ